MGTRAKVGVVGRVSVLVAALVVALVFLPTGAGATVPELLVKTPEDGMQGAGAGQFFGLKAIAADPDLPGNVYVSDLNSRISVFTPWGEFLRAFGWGVKDGGNELQVCTAQTGCQRGINGGGDGQFKGVNALGAGGGNVYAIDDEAHRIQVFSPEGEFLSSIGGDVVAHGPGDSSVDETQQLRIAASSGTFKLGFENPWSGGGKQETAALPFNASAVEVKAALNALSTIGGLGGSVSVTGGPGDATGSTPYTIVFEGNLGGDDVPELSIDRTGLGTASIGGMLRCSSLTEANAYEYRWLRNGDEIPGAESPTYTTVAADEGKSIQCKVIARNSAESVAIGVANPVYVAPPAGGVAPPVAPKSLLLRASIEGLAVGDPGGTTLTCGAEESFSGATSVAYRWYRNGVQIAGASASAYVVTEADLAGPAYFQCAVTASNAGTATTTKFSLIELSTNGLTEPPPDPKPASLGVQVRMDPPSHVYTASPGGAPEVCEAADTCRAGIARKAAGWFGEERYSDGLAVSPVDGALFVAEQARKRIQVFDSDGSFREEIALPKEPTALAVDDGGDLHVLLAEPVVAEKTTYYEIRTLKPHGPSAEFLGPTIAAEGAFSALAVDAAGNTYATHIPPGEGGVASVLEFDPAGKCLNCGTEGEGGKEGFDRVGGIGAIATAKACGADDVYVPHDISALFSGSGFRESFLNIFGPPPNPTLCPQPKVPPQILSQYARSVDADSAELQAEINPNFWNDTTYYLEYGTAPCSQGGCAAKPTQPASLTAKVTKARVKTAAVRLEGLQPGITYHYRFVTASGGGGPVVGPDRSFTTFHKDRAEQSCPANEAFRTGPSAALPDCRAYEMVTPLDKDGGDIRVLGQFTTGTPATVDESSTDGERLAFGTFHAFGDAESAPYTSQYVAARGAGGWASHGISPPHERLIFHQGILLDNELNALSPDLCEAWFRTFSEPALAPGAVVGYSNLYRRTDEECGGPGWEALTTVEPPNVAPAYYTALELAGLSADGQAAIYISSDSLPGSGAPAETCAESGCPGPRLYFRRTGEALPHFVCVLPDTSATACTAGSSRGGAGLLRFGNFQGALSEDGERVFWSQAFPGVSPLYVREHPDQPQSALAHGAAKGTGNLTEGSDKVTALTAAEGKAEFTTGSATATLLETKVGRFVAGQTVTALGKVPAGTTIKAVSGQALTLDKNATSSGTQTISSKGPMPFEVGQAITGKGIPPKTTILEAKAGELKLSKTASANGTGVPLSAVSDCTEAAKACTIAVSQEAEALSSKSSSRFWAAAADGSAAIFTTGEGAAGLYRFDVGTKATTRIAGKVPGVLGVSEDASHVYFASEEDCGGAGEAGQLNLYLYETGESCEAGELAFVATLDERDRTIYSAADPLYHPSRVSPDGLHAAFVSLASPTGYDNLDVETGEPAAEVYLYDAAAEGGQGKLVCASCNPSGSRPISRTIPNAFEVNPFNIPGIVLLPRIASQIPGFTNNLYGPRVLSADGSRLFFESFDALSPLDTNGVRDVYQWEAPGTGSCEEGAPSYSAQNEGCVDLISTGRASRDVYITDASLDGSNVFFRTPESISSQDVGLIDIYDARVDGGFPEATPPDPPCEGEACQGTSEAPNDPTPASESFEGAGNVKEEAAPPARKPCAKGKVRRKGRCVARHKRTAKAKRAKRDRRAAR